MRLIRPIAFAVLFVSGLAWLQAQQPTAPAAQGAPAAPAKKRILVIGAALGYEHDSISDSMATVWKLGRDNGLWDATLRTDYELISKKEIKQRNIKNLTTFDAIVFANSTGKMALDDEQKKDLLSFVHDDGKGVVGIHAALDTNYDWPEWGEMMGGWFDQHPWMTFQAPVVREDGTFPATKNFPKTSMKRDEIYQAKEWSRDKVNVLLRLDESKLNYDNNPRIHRTDHDFAVAWSKMYGKGRVFYSTLGHTNEAWSDPDITKMYEEAIKWVLGLTDGSTQPHPKPAS